MKYFVYVLRSEKTYYRYIGQTDDLERRINEHNSGLTKSIKYQLPFRLEYVEPYLERKDAVKREKFLKSGKGREWLDKNVVKIFNKKE